MRSMERWGLWQGTAARAIAGSLVGLILGPTMAQATVALDFSLESELSLAAETSKAAPKAAPSAIVKSSLENRPKPGGGQNSVSLSFAPPEPPNVPVKKVATWPKPFASFAARSPFDGGSQSLVARVVGHAEGTRTLTGEPTWAYWGHVDPGNRAWNRGTFSYQHAADSPEDADAKQLRRLAQQAKELEKQAQVKEIKLSRLEMLNGIDLANQAPLAALDRGYIEWLAEAKQMNLPETEAILWARTWSYWDPDLNTWNAPGLGNTRNSIETDQQRRQWAIAQVLQHCSRDAPQNRRRDHPGDCSATRSR